MYANNLHRFTSFPLLKTKRLFVSINKKKVNIDSHLINIVCRVEFLLLSMENVLEECSRAKNHRNFNFIITIRNCGELQMIERRNKNDEKKNHF